MSYRGDTVVTLPIYRYDRKFNFELYSTYSSCFNEYTIQARHYYIPVCAASVQEVSASWTASPVVTVASGKQDIRPYAR